MEERVTGIVVALLWKNQAFWPMLMNMLTARPVPLPAREELLSQPCNKNLKHPLRKKLALLVCKVSGTDSEVKDFLRTQPSSSYHPGENSLNKCMMSTSDSGCGMHVEKKSGSVFSPPLTTAINFLAQLAKRDLSYSAVCTARSALGSCLCTYDGAAFGCNELVKRLMKGVFEKKPALSRHKNTWDVNIV